MGWSWRDGWEGWEGWLLEAWVECEAYRGLNAEEVARYGWVAVPEFEGGVKDWVAAA